VDDLEDQFYQSKRKYSLIEIEGKYVSHMQWKDIHDESGPVMYERRKF
jgi:hypothetical protein